MVLPFHALQICPRPKADASVLVALEVMRRKEEFEFLAACPPVALPVGAGASRAVARAEALAACDMLDAAQPAEAVVRLEVDQALPEICECVLRPTLSVRAELALAFEAEVLTFVSSRLCFPCGPLSPAAGTSLRPREAKGKADFRGGLRALVTFPLNG